MTIVTMITAAICFIGDVNPLDGLCLSAFESDVVIECPTLGDSSVPMHVNSGDRNPGPGQVSFYSTIYDGAAVVGSKLLLSTPFESRGSRQQGAVFIASYFVPQDDETTFRGEFEACVCHTKSPRAADACEAAVSH